MIKRIAEMLSYMRPAYSKMDETFITKYIEPVGVFDDEAGNLIKIIGDDPEVMWSCHTDTVHMVSGTQSVKTKGQYVVLNEKDSSLHADNVYYDFESRVYNVNMFSDNESVKIKLIK